MGDEDSGYHWGADLGSARFSLAVGRAEDPMQSGKLRPIIFVLSRNLLLQPLLNQYMTGVPKGQAARDKP
jgi:hypothetical protein